VTALNGTIYVAGGLTTQGETDAVLAVDPASGAARQVATLPAPVAHAPLVALGGALYLVGGTGSTGAPLGAILRIDPVTGAVSAAGKLPMPLADAAAVALGSRAIVLGGRGSAFSADVFELRPRAR
jgi:N-acetylneuraminic acid mutarotase